MKIRRAVAEPDIEEKILYKHRISLSQIATALEEGKPKFLKIRDDLFMAIAHHHQYLTVIFQYREQVANLKTAYPSSEGQIRRYRKK